MDVLNTLWDGVLWSKPTIHVHFTKDLAVNHVVCHGIPSDKKILKDGDILNIDVTVIRNG